jgi:DNA-binding transcriptional ArsR family regulator
MSELDDVFVDEEEMNEKLIAEVLCERVNIGQNEGQIYFENEFENLNAARKLGTVLVARKAVEHRDVVEDQKVGPSELAEITGMKKGTVDPALKKLREKNLAKSDNGSYYVPNPNLSKMKDFIENGEKSE